MGVRADVTAFRAPLCRELRLSSLPARPYPAPCEMIPAPNRKPRLLQLFNRYRERGGEEQSAERIFRHAGRDFEMDRIWWDSRDWDGPDAPSKLGQLRRFFYNPDTVREITRRHAEEPLDALLCHNIYPIGSPSIYHAAQQLGVPVIQYLHNFRPFSVGGPLWAGDHVATESLQLRHREEILAGSWQGSVFKSALFSLVLKRLHRSGWLDAVTCWIAISDFIRDRFIEAGIPAERIHTLRHCWEPRNTRADLPDRGYYLYLARLIPEKGVAVALEAWRLLEEKLGPACPTLVVGGTGSEEDRVRAAAEGSARIEFRGFVEGAEKRELIEHCRAMLAPSVWWEALGLVTYEAYDCYKPMLASDSGGLQETITDGVTGFHHRRGDAAALARTVEQLEALGPDGRRAMGEAGHRWLLEDADPARWLDRFSTIVHGTLDPHR